MDTMSWFDATGLANLAKSALKEAQKTIDKALDIQEEEGKLPQSSLTSPGGNRPVWEGDGVPRSESEPQLSTSDKYVQDASIWGSFTGSFFENPKAQGLAGSNEPTTRPTNFISNQPKKTTAVFQPKKLYQPSEGVSPQVEALSDVEADPLSPVSIRDEVLSFPPVVYRKKEPRNYSNRLSAISSESDRRSSSSCEVLGSCTPDSDPSSSVRQSGSFGSVEVLTSSSSVEVLTSPSCDHKYSSDSISPLVEGEGEDGDDSYTETLTSTVLEPSKDPMLKSTSSLDTSVTDPPREGDCDAAAVSSCEEGTVMGSSGEAASLYHVSSTSSFLKESMLADAMIEHRDHSPISSERSELIKLGSSCHTSGDELETATSSDIEVISSPTPNGSSSAASRQSPARSKLGLASSSCDPHAAGKPSFITKGHQRELSETSSGGSDEHPEVDKLLKRIVEMTEILEVREAKLIDLSRINSDLQESNNHLQSQVESRLQKQEVSELSDEFTHRLAALERKFQQAIRERDCLRKELEQSKAAVTLAEEAAEKDQVIQDLRAEGEKLSKQQLTLNNLVKKLRAAERDNQKTISSLKAQLEECGGEVERAKKALAAKQDVERSQIEAVHQLTSANQRLEAQVCALSAQQDNLTSTIVSLQREVTESKEQCSDLQVRLAEARTAAEREVRKQLEEEWGETAEQRDQLESTVQQLREKLNLQSEQQDREVQDLRKEQAELIRRLEVAGAAAEDMAQSVSAATQPLVRQIDSLSANHTQAQATWERQERRLLQQIGELECRVTRLVESERGARETLVAGNARCSALEAQLATVQSQLHETTQSLHIYQQKLNRLESEHQENERLLKEELVEKEREKTSLEQQLAVERAALDAERRQTVTIQEQLKTCRQPSPPATPCSSPTLSLGHLSVTDSLASNFWPHCSDDPVETGSVCSRMAPVVYGHTTSILESLQSQLKQREGEVQQLQWELSKREVERAALSNELATLTARVEVQDCQLTQLASLKTEYDALLLLYGEKLEESQELRMDLQDVKDMYKAQIDQLLKKEPSS